MSQKAKLKQLKSLQGLETLIPKLSAEQVNEIAEDIKTIGVAYAGGGDYKRTIATLGRKYKGKSHKLYYGLIRAKHFERLLDHMVDHLTDATDQPANDAGVAAEG